MYNNKCYFPIMAIDKQSKKNLMTKTVKLHYKTDFPYLIFQSCWVYLAKYRKLYFKE